MILLDLLDLLVFLCLADLRVDFLLFDDFRLFLAAIMH